MARQQAQYFISFSLVDFGLTTALIIFFVVGLRMGAAGQPVGPTAVGRGDGLARAVGVPSCAGDPNFSSPLLRSSLRFSLPLLPFILGTWGLNVSHLHRAGRSAPCEALGLYTSGYQFARRHSIAMALNNAWQPFSPPERGRPQ